MVCLTSLKCEDNDTLRIGYYYQLDTSKVSPLAKLFSNSFSVKTTLKRYRGHEDVIQDLKAQKQDIFISNSFNYILVKESIKDIEPLVVFSDSSDNFVSYNSTIITQDSNKVKSLSNMEKMASGLSIAFSQPLSTSGHLIPRAFLQKRQIGVIEYAFGEYKFSGGHDKVVLDVAEGKIDIGACSGAEFVMMAEQGVVDSTKLKKLWTSAPLPEGPIMVRSNFEKKEQLKRLLLNLHKENPDVWTHILNTWGIYQPKQFIAGKDEYYDSLRNLFDSIRGLESFLGLYLLESE